jgi:TPP-dependent indolepyruvate ferredoxin oxidoreductase alpha subunit
MNIIDCMVVVLGDDPGANSSQKEQGTGISRK